MHRIIGLISVLVVVVACTHQKSVSDLEAERQQRAAQSEAVTQAEQRRQAEVAQRQAAQQAAVEQEQRRKQAQVAEAEQEKRRRQAQVAEAEAATQATIEQTRAGIRGTPLPVNYRQQIDAYFAATLIDPDSRKIEILKNPYGSLVCGYVNARNSFGGYTGRQVFATYFNAEGKLVLSQDDFFCSYGQPKSPQIQIWDLRQKLYATK
jgi:hypothetical protein